MAEDSIVNTSLQTASIQEDLDPLSDSQSESSSESEASYNEEINHGEDKATKKNKASKKETQEQKLKDLYKANQENSKTAPKPKKKKKGGQKNI